jgi:3-oxoacyl-[acyl-carrier-protein] synthase II
VNIPREMRLAISRSSVVSALGDSFEGINQAYAAAAGSFAHEMVNEELVPLARIHAEAQHGLEQFLAPNAHYREMDRSIQLGLYAAELLRQSLEPERSLESLAVFAGSSRGATGLLERAILEHHRNPRGRIPPLTSPRTTLGAIASTIARHIGSSSATIDFSITCSTALHGLFAAAAFLQSGFIDAVLCGAAEAPLTPFTVAQMRALRVHAHDTDDPYPCRPFSAEPRSASMVLGEGAGFFLVERACDCSNPLAMLSGIGCTQEIEGTLTGVDETGAGFLAAMQGALRMGGIPPSAIDAVICHAPGTVLGDASEARAVERLFGDKIPKLSSKWLTGHTFAASGALSLDLAIRLLRGEVPPMVLDPDGPRALKIPLEQVLVNAAGFGGNIVSVLVQRAR